MVELGSRSDNKQAFIETCPLVGSGSGAGNASSLQYSLGNPVVRRAWRAAVHRVTKSRHTEVG